MENVLTDVTGQQIKNSILQIPNGIDEVTGHLILLRLQRYKQKRLDSKQNILQAGTGFIINNNIVQTQLTFAINARGRYGYINPDTNEFIPF